MDRPRGERMLQSVKGSPKDIEKEQENIKADARADAFMADYIQKYQSDGRIDIQREDAEDAARQIVAEKSHDEIRAYLLDPANDNAPPPERFAYAERWLEIQRRE